MTDLSTLTKADERLERLGRLEPLTTPRFGPARWLALIAVPLLAHIAPSRAVIVLTFAAATAGIYLSARPVDGGRPSLSRLVGCIEALVVLTLLLDRDAVSFAVVWLFVQALPLPTRVHPRDWRVFNQRLPVAIGIAIAAGGAAAFQAGVGTLLFGSRYVGAGWMTIAYTAVVVARPMIVGRADRKGLLRRGSPLAGVLAVELALFFTFGRTSAGAVIAAIVSTGAALAVSEAKSISLRPVLRKESHSVWGVPAANVVAGLTAIGLAIRLLVHRGLWLDEAISVAQVRVPYSQFLQRLAAGDIHPPLYGSLLWLTTRAIGSSEFAVRLPSIVAGTVLIPLLYVAGRDIHSRRAGVIAAALGTFAPVLVWYSQEARMYALLLVFSTASLWFQVRAIRKGRTSDWIAFGLCCAAMLWTHYFAILQVVTQHAALAVLVRRSDRDGREARPTLVGWGRAALVMFVALIPLAPFLQHQLSSSGQLASLNVPSRNPRMNGISIYAILANFVWAIWGYHSAAVMRGALALWPLIMLLVFFLLGRGRPRVVWLIVASIVVPITTLLIAGLKLRDLFELRYFITAVPAALILMAQLVTRSSVRRGAMGVVIALLLVSFGGALADQQINQRNPRLYDFRGALEYVKKRGGPNDLVFYSPRYLDSVVEYYAPHLRSRAAIRGPLLAGSRPPQVFVITAWNLVDRRETKSKMLPIIRRETRYRHLVDELDRPGVRVAIWQ